MGSTSSPKEFAEALRTERANKKRRTWLVAGGAVISVLLVGGLAWLFLFSATFPAEETSVEGARIVEVEEYVAAAAVPSGEPLARVDIRAVEERVRSLPEVADVEVARDFPNAVRVVVTEREPAYQLREREHISWVDGTGIIFRTGEELRDDLPVVEIPDVDERLLTDVATVVGQLPDEVVAQLELIRVGSVDMIELRLVEDRTVVWGSAEESALKAEVLSALLQVDAGVYDVSAPNHPTTS